VLAWKHFLVDNILHHIQSGTVSPVLTVIMEVNGIWWSDRAIFFTHD